MPAFLFTDIEGSTGKWQEHPQGMPVAMAAHDRLLAGAVEEFGGRVVKHTGDGFMAVFSNRRAIECALSIQKGVMSTDWAAVGDLRVRIGIESGDALEKNGDFFGMTVSRTQRLMSAGWGGQTVIGENAAVSETLPPGASLEDMGAQMLKDLQQPQQIYVLRHGKTGNPAPPLRTVSVHPNNLPVQPTPFVGREKELRELCLLLKDPQRRLVTILGYGGTGKTRLALQAAAESVESFKHGVWFVPLANADCRADIVSAAAGSLSCSFSPGKPEENQLAGFLSKREILMILDNFDHLTEHGSLVSTLLRESPSLKVLVSSRARLGIREETVFDLCGMQLPRGDKRHDTGCDSVKLFIDAASRHQPGFSPEDSKLDAIAGICRLTEGLPLGIELAASWIRTISCTEIEAELEVCAEILQTSSPDIPDRHRSMQAVFSYSWKLLDEHSRSCLAALSVFEGGFSRQGTSQVAGCSLGDLKHLMDSSLITTSVTGRYKLHPLTRQFAGDLVENRISLSHSHAEYYSSLAEGLLKEMGGPGQKRALDEIELEYFNIRKAAVFAVRNADTAILNTLIPVMSLLLHIRSRFCEGVAFFSAMLRETENLSETCSKEPLLEIRARIHERLSTFHMISGDKEAAEAALITAAELSKQIPDPGFRILCNAGLGNIEYSKGNIDSAEKHWSMALDEAVASNLEPTAGPLFCNLAGVLKKRGDFDGARELIARAEKLIHAREDPFFRASLLSVKGDVERSTGNFGEAHDCFTESLDICRRIGNARAASYCLERLALMMKESSMETAIVHARESLDFAEKADSPLRAESSRLTLGELLESTGRYDSAREVLGQFDEAFITDSQKERFFRLKRALSSK